MADDETSSLWRFNLQTLVLLGGMAAALVGWGYTFSELQSDTDRNTAGVENLRHRLEQNDSATALLNTRVVALEKVATDSVLLRRELEKTIGEFKSDIAVIKEILVRMDKDAGP